jgi:4-amino-4-deoxy-L-arabinose transferase-like glycosyltransferase
MWPLVIAVFIVLTLPVLLAEGMFMDGLIYAAVSKNLANGVGTFWFPKLSETFGNPFNEHPPLVFLLQSWFFKLFGDGFYVERAYSLATAVVQILILIKLWSWSRSGRRSGNWLPVLVFITVPTVFWCYNNNMIENTMAIFTSLSVLFILKAMLQEGWLRTIWLVVAGLLIFIGLMSKGPVALFPLAVPFLFWLVYKSNRFSKIIFDTILLIAVTGIPLVVMLFISDAALESFQAYLDQQLIRSLSGNRLVVSRFSILSMLITQLLPWILALTAAAIPLYLKRHSISFSSFYREALLFLLIGFSASLPMMVSPKQMEFYLLPSMPFFSVAIALVLQAAIASYKLGLSTAKYRVAIAGAWIVLAISVVYSFSFIGKINRDAELLHDIKSISATTGNGAYISLSDELFEQWNLYGYFSRFYEINLGIERDEMPYLITLANDTRVFTGYEAVDIELYKYKLHRKK